MWPFNNIVTDRLVKSFLRKADMDQDGKITVDDFVKFVKFTMSIDDPTSVIVQLK